MANVWYPKGLEALMNGEIDWVSHTIKLALVSSSYSFGNTHDTYADISAYVIDAPASLSSKSVAALTDRAVLDAADPTFSSVAGGSTVGALVIFWTDGGSPETTQLLQFADTAVGLPYSTDGGNIPVQFDNGVNKVGAIKYSDA